MPSVVSSAVILNTTDALSTYAASSAFTATGGSGRILLAFVQACQSNTGTVLSATANGAAMTEIVGGVHSGGGSRPVHGIFAIAAEAGGDFTISAAMSPAGRSCTIVCAEVDGADIAALVGASVTREATDGLPARTLVPTAAGSLLLSVQSTRRGTGSPFTPLAGVTEIADLTTGATATNDHSAFVGAMLSTGATEHTLGADDASGNTIDTLFSAVELLAAGTVADLDASAAPGVGSASSGGLLPTTSATSSATVTPGVGGGVATGRAAQVIAGSAATSIPGTGEAFGVGLASARSASSLISLMSGGTAAAGLDPSVGSGSGAEVMPAAGAVAGVGAAPAVTRGSVATPTAGALGGMGRAPTVVREQTAALQVAAGEASGAGVVPRVIANAAVSPPPERIVAVSAQSRVVSVSSQNRIVRAA